MLDIIQVELSKVIGYYAIHYLNDYISKVEAGNIAKAHHSLSSKTISACWTKSNGPPNFGFLTKIHEIIVVS